MQAKQKYSHNSCSFSREGQQACHCQQWQSDFLKYNLHSSMSIGDNRG